MLFSPFLDCLFFFSPEERMGVFQAGFGLGWELIILFFVFVFSFFFFFFVWYGQTQGKGTVPADHTRTWLF